MPASVISGYWPFGGSVMIEVRHLPSIRITLSPGSHVEGVVAAAAAGRDFETRIEDRRASDRRRFTVRVAGLEVRLVDLGLAAGNRGRFFVGQRQAIAKLPRPRERSQRRHVVRAGEIGLAVRDAAEPRPAPRRRTGAIKRAARPRRMNRSNFIPPPPRSSVSGYRATLPLRLLRTDHVKAGETDVRRRGQEAPITTVDLLEYMLPRGDQMQRVSRSQKHLRGKAPEQIDHPCRRRRRRCPARR